MFASFNFQIEAAVERPTYDFSKRYDIFRNRLVFSIAQKKHFNHLIQTKDLRSSDNSHKQRTHDKA